MKTSLPFSYEDLVAAFPVATPAELSSPESYGDVWETSLFHSKTWPEANAKILGPNFEAPLFLSPLAMHYFFPAIINWSLEDLSAANLSLDYLLNVIAENDPHFTSWMKRLSTQQLALVERWLLWLQGQNKKDSFKSLSSALETIQLLCRLPLG